MIGRLILCLMALAIGVLLGVIVRGDEICVKNCRPDDRVYRLTRNEEGLRLFSYTDAAGNKTIGFGHKIKPSEHFDEPITGEDAEALLEKDEAAAGQYVSKMVFVALHPSQFGALVDFTFNLGPQTLKRSTLLKLVNKEQHNQVPAQFMKYDHVHIDGVPRVLAGLFSRRQAEANLYSETP
jgi:lysozyme